MPIRTLARSAFPLYLTTAAATAGSIVNTVLLGHRATASLAAFALAMAVYGPVVAAVTGVLRGVMPFVAELGSGRVVGGALWLSYGIGLTGSVVVAAVPLIGAASGVARPVLDHLGLLPVTLAAAVVAQSVGASASSTLVVLGRERTVLRCGLAGAAAAALLSVVAVPRLGAEGAGLAILTATTAYAGQVQLALRGATGLRRTLRPGPFDRSLIVRLAATGLPMAGTVLVKFVVLGVLTFAAARLGTIPAAAHGVAETLVNLIYAVAVAVGQSAVPLVSRAPAAADARRAVRAAVLLATSAVAVLSVVLVVFGRWILPLFTGDSAVRAALSGLLPVVAVVIVGDAVQAVYGFGLLGLRTTVPSLISTTVVFGALCVAAVPIADAGGLAALWSALAVANLLQAVSKATLFGRRARRRDESRLAG